jgi:hypothetical protein
MSARAPDPGETEMERLQGRCHCGGVQVSLPADAYGVVACHCGDCQRLHGNFFAMLVAPGDAVEWSGELAPAWYDSSPEAQRAHCPRCGSRLAKRPRSGARTMVSVGLFDRHLPRRIMRQVWTDAHPDWYTPPPVPPA